MIFFDNRTNKEISKKIEELIYKAVESTLDYEKKTKDAEVSVSFVTREEIKELNTKFRGKDSITDVLSFPLTEVDEEFCINPETGQIMLGDIVLCVDRAREQALEYGHALEREITFLTVHSMLHLIGYDHMTEDEEQVMREKQRNILAMIGVSRDEE